MKKFILAFTVLVLSVSCSDKPFVIVQVADAQLGFDAAIKGQEPGAVYVNDLTYEAELLRKAVDAVNALSPDAVVFTGDQVNLVDNQEQWDLFTEIVSGIDKDVDCLHIPGNHDVFFREGGVDCAQFAARFGSDRFVFDKGNVRLVGINSNLIKYDDPSESEHFGWMKDVLTEGPAEQVKIVFTHHPFFLADIDEEDSYFPVQRVKRKTYFDLFSEAGVDAVYAGHLHDSSEGEYAGVPMKTTTSAAYQIGKSRPSLRVITVEGGVVYDRLLELE